jgi:hypothetical protein
MPKEEMFRRKIELEQVDALMLHPDQIVEAHRRARMLPVLKLERRKPLSPESNYQ